MPCNTAHHDTHTYTSSHTPTHAAAQIGGGTNYVMDSWCSINPTILYCVINKKKYTTTTNYSSQRVPTLSDAPGEGGVATALNVRSLCGAGQGQLYGRAREGRCKGVQVATHARTHALLLLTAQIQ